MKSSLNKIVDVSVLRERTAPYWTDLQRFWADPYTYQPEPASPNEGFDAEWITHESGVPWLELDIGIPRHEDMVEEALACLDLFVSHRGADSWGWQSCCLHGIDSQSTRSPGHYGFADDENAPYKWTELAERCPVTTAFLKRLLKFRNIFRVRFMLLKPMGYILPHIDTWSRSLTSLSIALNNPEGAHFKLLEQGEIPFRAGKAFLVDISRTHGCVNLSDTPRLHIIAHCEEPLTGFNSLVRRSYAKSWGRQIPLVAQ